MIFWITGGALTAIATIALAAPAFNKRMAAQFQGREQAVYADQLSEVERDKSLGLITGPEAEAARIEVKRRMLGAAKKSAPKNVEPAQGKRVLLIAALLVPVLGVGTYIALGNPQIPSLPYAARTAERANAAKMDQLVARLRARLEATPDSPVEGWILLGQTYMRMARPDQAIDIYQMLIKRGDAVKNPEVNVLYAEAQISSDDGIVTPKAEAALDRTLKLRPKNVAAIFYKAQALEQSGELGKAFDILRQRISLETTRQPWMATLAQRANRLAKRIGEKPVTLPRENQSNG